MKGKNRLIEYIGQIPIYVNNRVTLDLHYKDFKPFADLASKFGIPVRFLIKMMISPCEKCGHSKISIPLHDMRHQNSNPGKPLAKIYKCESNGQGSATDTETQIQTGS